MPDTETRTREQRARRALERRGLRLEKSRVRDPRALGFGTFSILDARGLSPQLVATLASIEQVEAWLDTD